MNDYSILGVFAITILILILQLKKYVQVKNSVKKNSSARRIEKNPKSKGIFFSLALLCVLDSVLLFFSSFEMSYALLVWILGVVFVTNALNYDSTQCVYVSNKEVFIGNQWILKKQISRVQKQRGKVSRLLLTNGEKMNISEFQAEQIEKGFVS